MRNTPPALKFHETKRVYYTRSMGVYYSLGSDKRAAEVKHAEIVGEWAREKKRDSITKGRRVARLTVTELYQRFIDSKVHDRSAETVTSLRNWLRAFVSLHFNQPASSIRPTTIHEFRQGLIRRSLSVRTINHQISAIKAMFRWAAELEMIPPIMVDAVKLMRLPPVKPRGYSIEKLHKMLAKTTPPHLQWWIMLQWLTMARPMEMCRIVAGKGEWVEPWLFKPHQAKTSNRLIVFSEAALRVLSQCAPRWSSHAAYRRALNRYGCLPPHPLRHGAATYLLERGVDRPTVDLLLGHALPRVSETYMPKNWRTLRESTPILEEPLACAIPTAS